MSSEFELLLKGVHLVDPVNRIDAIRDIAIAGGRIAAVEEAIDPTAARRVETLTGKIAVPGIIDTHVHASPLAGGNGAHRMLARAGVTTALEMSGPVEAVWKLMAAHGAGLNLACVHAVAPGLTVENRHPSRSVLEKLLSRVVSDGALGLKILGGHLPLTPAATERCIDLAHRRGRYCAFHAGTTRAGSNLNGLLEAISLAGENRLHLAHINSYCRGQVKTAIEETMEAIDALEAHPNILSESYLSPINGTSGKMVDGKPFSQATPASLRRFGFSADYDGMKKAISRGIASIMVEKDGETVLETGPAAAAVWEAAETDLNVSFDVNPADSRFLLATARGRNGRFVVDAISTDGGGIPRNVIIENGLLLVAFGALTLSEFVIKTSLNPAAMLGLIGKGRLDPGADADITIIDPEARRAFITLVGGRIVMYDGQVLGSGGTALVLPEGEKQTRQWVSAVKTIEPDRLLGRPIPNVDDPIPADRS